MACFTMTGVLDAIVIGNRLMMTVFGSNGPVGAEGFSGRSGFAFGLESVTAMVRSSHCTPHCQILRIHANCINTPWTREELR